MLIQADLRGGHAARFDVVEAVAVRSTAFWVVRTEPDVSEERFASIFSEVDQSKCKTNKKP